MTLNDIMKFLNENKSINENKSLNGNKCINDNKFLNENKRINENKFLNEGKRINENKFLNQIKNLNENNLLSENKQNEKVCHTDKFQYIEKDSLEYLCDEETVYGEESFNKTISLMKKVKERILGSKTKIADGETGNILHKSETISKLKESFVNLRNKYQTEEEILVNRRKDMAKNWKEM